MKKSKAEIAAERLAVALKEKRRNDRKRKLDHEKISKAIHSDPPSLAEWREEHGK